MSKLKLFISHSSRLDDIEHPHDDDQRNWELLQETRTAIKNRYGHRVEVLVDKYNLTPGEDWDRELNLWMAECHMAIILFSKRAIEKSNWVAKEASILSWRRSLSSEFKLIPALLDGEVTPEDLQKDFFGVLKIDVPQCIRKVSSAQDVINGIDSTIQDLESNHPQTPLEELQAGIAKILEQEPTTNSLSEALNELGINEVIGASPDPRKRYADLLARHLINGAEKCFNHFQIGIDKLQPKPLRERANSIYKSIRALWVECSAAGAISNAREHKNPLLLNGLYLSHPGPIPDDEGNTKFYTLERYIERSCPTSDLYRIVSAETTLDLEQLQDEIRNQFLSRVYPPTISNQELDNFINNDPNTIILLIRSTTDPSSLPDNRLLPDLRDLHSVYQKLIIVIGVVEPRNTAPKPIKVIRPTLKPERENKAYLGEMSAHDFLQRI